MTSLSSSSLSQATSGRQGHQNLAQAFDLHQLQAFGKGLVLPAETAGQQHKAMVKTDGMGGQVSDCQLITWQPKQNTTGPTEKRLPWKKIQEKKGLKHGLKHQAIIISLNKIIVVASSTHGHGILEHKQNKCSKPLTLIVALFTKSHKACFCDAKMAADLWTQFFLGRRLWNRLPQNTISPRHAEFCRFHLHAALLSMSFLETRE